MHGIIFAELRNYAETSHGTGTWNALLRTAGLQGKIYMQVQEYPDADLAALVVAASSVTRRPVAEVLEEFGEFITPALLNMFGHLLRAEWKTIDVIDHTEGTVHTVVRVRNPGAKPPKLQTVRRGPDEVVLIYTSPRQMCGFAIGIGKGLAQHFGEHVIATQALCMHKGASKCEIVFRKVS
jgi:hypothetical protein